jgi:DNA polymerase-3 subunit alpha
MTLDQGNTDKLNIYRQELDRLAIRLLPPDINRSDVDFAVEDTEKGRAIRYALAAVRNVGHEAMRALVAERWRNGPFQDIWELARRLDHRQVNKRQLESLARAGAFDPLIDNRAQALAAVDLMLRFANRAAAERDSQQTSLFGGGAAAEPEPAPPLPAAAMWSQTEKLGHEFDAVGFYLSAHPLDAYRQALAKSSVVSYAELKERMARGGSHFKLAGTVLAKRERNSAKGNRYAFVQLSDASGMYEVTAFQETLAANRELFEPGRSLLLEVEAREDGEAPRLTVQKVSDIEQVGAQRGADLRIFLSEPEPLAGLKAILDQHRGGRVAVTLLLQIAPGREVEVALPGRYAIGREVRAALKSVRGVIDVQEV